jgi:histone-lysine N-methyltransferase SETMAR
VAINYELLPPDQTIDSTLYCSQLNKLKLEIQKSRPELINRKGVVFHHANAKPHTSLKTRKKRTHFYWDVLPKASYSKDIAPSDYHFFRSLQNNLHGKKNIFVNAVKPPPGPVFLKEKPSKFSEEGIMQLPMRWRKTIHQNGNYIIINQINE